MKSVSKKVKGIQGFQANLKKGSSTKVLMNGIWYMTSPIKSYAINNGRAYIVTTDSVYMS